MRILQVSRVFWPNIGGIERHVQWLSEALIRRGHVCDVVTLNRSFADLSPYPPYDFLPVTEKSGIHIYRIPFKGSTRYPLAPRVRRFIPRYDLVHIHAIDFLADWVTLLKPWHQRPVVLSTHGGFFHTEFGKGWKPLWFNTMTRALLSRVDRLLFTSDQDETLFRKITQKGQKITQAVDLSPYARLEREPEPGHWITIGRVDMHKGLKNLLKALAVVRDKSPEVFNMQVIGPAVVPGLVEELELECDRLQLNERVRFLGKVPEAVLVEALRTAELGLFPAEYESFGISVVEAMGAGVVPVLNDIAAFRAFIKGENGFLTEFKDPEQAAITILQARDRVRADRSLSETARRSAQVYDWARVVVEVEGVYQELV
jgi:alpha-1,3-mannosyltransferase